MCYEHVFLGNFIDQGIAMTQPFGISLAKIT